jgi:hypothetical protein
LIAGCFVVSYATQARIISMGKHAGFFLDEMSMFTNPANVNMYPNLILGGMGTYVPNRGSSDETNALTRYNRDPINPSFGAIITYDINQKTDTINESPKFSIGAVFNRYDPLLDFVTPGSGRFYGPSNAVLVKPVGKVDVLMGYALENGTMFGGNAYAAFQRITNDHLVEYESSVFKGNLGTVLPVGKTMDLEISSGAGLITAIGGTVDYSALPFDTSAGSLVLAQRDYLVRGDIRLFSGLTILDGDFVSHLGAEYVTLKHGKISLADMVGGIGLNVNIDKGFFWAGIEGLYEQQYEDTASATDGIGARVSFGIERNVVWDWFVIRVGGAKKIMYKSKMDAYGQKIGYWEQNPEADASDKDLIGFGIGLNVENRLKFDIVVAEDIPYTLTNLFSGPQHHIITRIDATYAF